MDAVDCMKAVTRMLKSGTIDCAIQKYISAQKKNDYEGMVKAAEQWAAEHPIKTRQSEFLKQWPEADVDENGVLQTCPALISASHRDQTGWCATLSNKCENCRKAFWFTEVEL